MSAPLTEATGQAILAQLEAIETRLVEVESRQTAVSDNQGRAWLATVDLKRAVQRFMDKLAETTEKKAEG